MDVDGGKLQMQFRFVVHLAVSLMLAAFSEFDEAVVALFGCYQIALELDDDCKLELVKHLLYRLLQSRPDRFSSAAEARDNLVSLFRKQGGSELKRNAEDLAAYLVGAADEQGGLEYLEIASESADLRLKFDASVLLSEAYGDQSSKLVYWNVQKDAAEGLGRTDYKAWALKNIGVTYIFQDDWCGINRVKQELAELISKVPGDSLVRGLASSFFATASSQLGQYRDCIQHNVEAVKALKELPQASKDDISIQLNVEAVKALKELPHDIALGVGSIRRRAWTTSLIVQALSHNAVAYSKLKEDEPLIETAEELQQFVRRYPSALDIADDRLQYLKSLFEVWYRRGLKSTLTDFPSRMECFQEGEIIAAQILLLADRANDNGSYIAALVHIVQLSVQYLLDEAERTGRRSEDRRMEVFEIVDSILAEAERLAWLYPVRLLNILSQRGIACSTLFELEKCAEHLKRFGKKFFEVYYNFGASSDGRIFYQDNWKNAFRLLQTIFFRREGGYGKISEALVWAERERARDLIYNLKLNHHEELKVFDTNDDEAWGEIQSISKHAGEDTVFLVYSAFNRFTTLCSYLLHSASRPTGRFMRFQGSLADDVQQTVQFITDGSDSLWQDLKWWHQVLISPFKKELETIQPEKLVIVPAEELSVLPFAALYDEDELKFLVQKYAISYIPSLRMFKQCQDQSLHLTRTLAGAAGRKALVIGNPHVEGAEPLPGSEEEAQFIRDTLQNKGFDSVEFLQQENATMEAAVEALPTADWVHIASHAIVSSEFPHGAILLAGSSDQASSSEFASASAAAEVMSIRHQAQPREERILLRLLNSPSWGKITGDDILRLWGPDNSEGDRKTKLRALVVVLSACLSGRGELCGEGVLGLYRSLHVAGVPTIVSSLWPVNDDSSRAFMEGVYKNLSQGMELGFAVKKAMISMIENDFEFQIRDWAPFVISGCSTVKLC